MKTEKEIRQEIKQIKKDIRDLATKDAGNLIWTKMQTRILKAIIRFGNTKKAAKYLKLTPSRVNEIKRRFYKE